jgi:hypothetical protein
MQVSRVALAQCRSDFLGNLVHWLTLFQTSLTNLTQCSLTAVMWPPHLRSLPCPGLRQLS